MSHLSSQCLTSGSSSTSFTPQLEQSCPDTTPVRPCQSHLKRWLPLALIKMETTVLRVENKPTPAHLPPLQLPFESRPYLALLQPHGPPFRHSTWIAAPFVQAHPASGPSFSSCHSHGGAVKRDSPGATQQAKPKWTSHHQSDLLRGRTV